jgi:hypothetical protein
VKTVVRLHAGIVGALAWVAAAALGAGCSSSPPPADPCPDDLPASCPTPSPSYASDIAPIVQQYCFPCHATGGIEAEHFDYSTYAGLYASRAVVLTQVNDCLMPPSAPIPGYGVDAGTAPLTTEARLALLGWLVCGAPDN